MLKFIDTRLAGLDAWFARRTAWLHRPRAGAWAIVLVPVLLGLLSLASGQDDGWDMRNYHLYNVHALLNGRIGFDFSPAGFQSYFNPTLELPYYYLNQWLPPRAAGFVMGALHGLAFLLLAGIARQLLGDAAPRRTVLLLAAAGLFAPGFLSELGNTMGDNLSALPALASLYLVLRCWDALPQWQARVAWTVLAAGAAMGASAGLKLTNATYAVALCAALLTAPLAWWQRLRLALVYGTGVLGGMAISGGWWFLKMWHTFGNPLFPQFNNIFRSPLAQDGGVIDVFFRPQGWMENLLWPFIFAFNTRRVSEIPLKLALWPVLYMVLAALLVVWLLRRSERKLAPRSAFLLVFVAVAYLVWMRMFSIYRYLVPLELLAPLAIWLAWQYIAPQAQRVAGVLLAALALGVFPIANWGHAEWAGQAFSAEVPPIARPADSIVFFAQPDPPSGWMATFMPKQVRVMALGTGLPESPAWRARQLAAIAERPGPHYLLLSAARNDRDGTRLRKLAVAQSLGLTDDAAGCDKLEWLMKRVRLQVELRRLPAGGCTFDLPPQHRIDLAAQDRITIAQAADRLQQYGLQLDAASCTTHRAAVGAEPRPFLWCRVGARDRTAAQ
ncbi:Protein of unknown function [Duganella sp. CF402]|uniref:DUF2029 domain-containing protein n=1 Tax=unclassified Duganella TaxID=2636909 RepID=UPI0008C8CA17|nr:MULTISPECIES: DUF2029 domain-containing protein [unclassified Duganella]RZT06273.1 uncharacterized protein DUF2029 [Duganella sp. BK701]SEM69628.1 Protein of unknown function [Duganella sp. CF402]